MKTTTTTTTTTNDLNHLNNFFSTIPWWFHVNFGFSWSGSGANILGYLSRGWSTEYHICYYVSKCLSWSVVFRSCVCHLDKLHYSRWRRRRLLLKQMTFGMYIHVYTNFYAKAVAFQLMRRSHQARPVTTATIDQSQLIVTLS